MNSIRLMAAEFPQTANEYAIVFATSGDDAVSVVILGARQNESPYLSADGPWKARYILRCASATPA